MYLDNVALHEAEVTMLTPEDLFLFETNPTGETKSIALSGSYVDADGNAVSGSVTLHPFTSVVLIKESP